MLAVRRGRRAGAVEWCLRGGLWPLGWPSPGVLGCSAGLGGGVVGARDAAEES